MAKNPAGILAYGVHTIQASHFIGPLKETTFLLGKLTVREIIVVIVTLPRNAYIQ